jgi:eukaryotic-like serine/threonine-protein kinase
MRESTGSYQKLGHPVGKYLTLAELGRGGMATVYLAVAKGPADFNKLVVLKMLRPHLADDPLARRLFLEEAKLAAKLNHPNVVHTYEIVQESEQDVLVMEYLAGQSVYNLVKRVREQKRPMPLSMHLQIIAATLEGLSYAHEMLDYDGTPLKIVHRDVSPHNMFVTYDGQVKLLDFGIAKAATSTNNTEDGVLKGKIAYMCPEQVVGKDLDQRGDLFAMGAVLWEAVAGQRLWKDVPDVTIMHQLANGHIPSPRSIYPEVDNELERITMKALAADREERYQTAEDFHTDLTNYMVRLSQVRTSRELGKYMTELFHEEQKQMMGTIERRLRRAQRTQEGSEDNKEKDTNLAVVGDDGSDLLERHSSRSFLEEDAEPDEGTGPTDTLHPIMGAPSTGNTKMAQASPIVPASQPVRNYSAWLIGVLSIVVVLLAWTVWSLNSHDRTDEKAAAGLPTTERIELQLRASPSAATLKLDGIEISNPHIVSNLKDNSSHTLRVEAPGYLPETRSIVCDHSQKIEVSLVAIPKEPMLKSPPRASESSPLPSAVPPATTTKKAKPPPVVPRKPNCDHPFFIDERGIKTLRPECR